MSSMISQSRWVLTIVFLLAAATPYAVFAEEEHGTAVASQGNRHITSPGSPHEPYNSDPPTSGPHVQWVAKWGAHRIAVPLEVQVHNLEDGGVVIQYNCSDCPDLVNSLEGLIQHPDIVSLPRAFAHHNDQRFMRLIVAPYPSMEHKVALTAWGRIDTLDDYNEARILRFIKIESDIGGQQEQDEDTQHQRNAAIGLHGVHDP